MGSPGDDLDLVISARKVATATALLERVSEDLPEQYDAEKLRQITTAQVELGHRFTEALMLLIRYHRMQ